MMILIVMRTIDLILIWKHFNFTQVNGIIIHSAESRTTSMVGLTHFFGKILLKRPPPIPTTTTTTTTADLNTILYFRV